LDEHREVKRGRVVLGTPPTASVPALPGILAAFRRDFPGIEIRFNEGPTAALVTQLQGREIDLSFLSWPSGHTVPTGIVEIPLSRTRTGVALSEHHPLARRDRLALRDLADVPLVVYASGFTMRTIALAACRRAGFEPIIAYESSVAETVCGLVAAGLGFTILTAQRARHHGLSFVPCEPRPADRVISIAWNTSPSLSPVAALLRDRILSSHGNPQGLGLRAKSAAREGA